MKRILRNSKKNFLQDPGRNLSRNFTWEWYQWYAVKVSNGMWIWYLIVYDNGI